MGPAGTSTEGGGSVSGPIRIILDVEESELVALVHLLDAVDADSNYLVQADVEQCERLLERLRDEALLIREAKKRFERDPNIERALANFREGDGTMKADESGTQEGRNGTADSALRECPACGRETSEPVECKVCQRERVMMAAEDLLTAGKAVLASAFPNEREHPRMAAAFRQMRAAVEKATNSEVRL